MNTRHILIVDDDAAARRMMRRLLERRGYSVDEAHDGRSGLDQIHASLPTAVLLDLRMPGELSGVDVARQLRSDPQTRELPVIVVSATTHLELGHDEATLDCAAYIEKPVDFSVLDAVLSRVIPAD